MWAARNQTTQPPYTLANMLLYRGGYQIQLNQVPVMKFFAEVTSWRSIASTAVLSGFLLAAGNAYGAIAQVVVPEEARSAPGNGATVFPFGHSPECRDGFRFQQLIEGSEIGTGNITSIAFRLDDGETPFGPHTYGDMQVKLSSTSKTLGTMSKTFADNTGSDETLVFTGDLTVDAGVTASPPNPFDFQLPVKVPFEFDGSSKNLLVDVTVGSCPPGVSNVAFDGDTRHLRDEYAFDKDAASAPADTGLGGLVTEIVLSTPPPTAPLYDCPFGSGGGDRLTRGFYLENFPAKRLDRVTLQYYPRSAGAYRVQLTAREGSYDGRIIGGTQTATFRATSASDVITHTFDFGGATVTQGATVTFSQQLLSQPPRSAIFYDTGSGSGCADVTQTVGTSPPLDSVRRDRVGVRVTSVDRMRGLGGNWTVIGHDGEGFMVDITKLSQLVMIWFTYDNVGNQMWLYGVADNFESNRATMNLLRLTGPVFGPAFNPTDVVFENWGTLSVIFDDCRSGEVLYNSFTGFGSGSYDIARIYDPEQGVCP